MQIIAFFQVGGSILPSQKYKPLHSCSTFWNVGFLHGQYSFLMVIIFIPLIKERLWLLFGKHSSIRFRRFSLISWTGTLVVLLSFVCQPSDSLLSVKSSVSKKQSVVQDLFNVGRNYWFQSYVFRKPEESQTLEMFK